MGAAARQLLEEFRLWVKWYNVGAATLGIAFGAIDSPAVSSRAATPQPPALTWHAEHPKELGFWRQLLLTTPGIMLALRLGRRARELAAPPSALVLAAGPALSVPL